MNTEIIMQYITYALIAIGILAFFVSAITQVIKEMPGLKNIQTNIVALVISIILCLVAVPIICLAILQIAITWYYFIAAVIAAFLVYLVATGGWEKLSEIWNRTKYSARNNPGGDQTPPDQEDEKQ